MREVFLTFQKSNCHKEREMLYNPQEIIKMWLLKICSENCKAAAISLSQLFQGDMELEIFSERQLSHLDFKCALLQLSLIYSASQLINSVDWFFLIVIKSFKKDKPVGPDCIPSYLPFWRTGPGKWNHSF